MNPIFRNRQSVINFYQQYPEGVCYLAKDDKQILCKNLKKAEKVMKKFKWGV